MLLRSFNLYKLKHKQKKESLLSTVYMTSDQEPFAISKVVPDWHELC